MGLWGMEHFVPVARFPGEGVWKISAGATQPLTNVNNTVGKRKNTRFYLQGKLAPGTAETRRRPGAVVSVHRNHVSGVE